MTTPIANTDLWGAWFSRLTHLRKGRAEAWAIDAPPSGWPELLDGWMKACAAQIWDIEDLSAEEQEDAAQRYDAYLHAQGVALEAPKLLLEVDQTDESNPEWETSPLRIWQAWSITPELALVIDCRTAYTANPLDEIEDWFPVGFIKRSRSKKSMTASLELLIRHGEGIYYDPLDACFVCGARWANLGDDWEEVYIDADDDEPAGSVYLYCCADAEREDGPCGWCGSCGRLLLKVNPNTKVENLLEVDGDTYCRACAPEPDDEDDEDDEYDDE